MGCRVKAVQLPCHTTCALPNHTTCAPRQQQLPIPLCLTCPALLPSWPLLPVQLLSYSTFLGDTRGASRLLSGLGGLWLYGLLHSATPLTKPLHEALLAGSPRLLYRCGVFGGMGGLPLYLGSLGHGLPTLVHHVSSV